MCSSPKINEGYGTERSVIDKCKVGPTEMEIQEWYMELRTNNVCMDEHTSDVRMEKIKDLENCEAKQRQDKNRITEERDRMSEERERTNIAREKANEVKEREYRARELANVEREGINNCRELKNDTRDW